MKLTLILGHFTKIYACQISHYTVTDQATNAWLVITTQSRLFQPVLVPRVTR